MPYIASRDLSLLGSGEHTLSTLMSLSCSSTVNARPMFSTVGANYHIFGLPNVPDGCTRESFADGEAACQR